MRKFRYDYYRVNVPDYLGTWEERANIAVYEARERASLYCVPCEWSIVRESGDDMVVRRKRRIYANR